MTTRVLNVILTDGTMPYSYTTHATAANSCAPRLRASKTRLQTTLEFKQILRVHTEAIALA